MAYKMWQNIAGDIPKIITEFDSIDDALKWQFDNNGNINIEYLPDDLEEQGYHRNIKFQDWVSDNLINCFYNLEEEEDDEGKFIPFCTFTCKRGIEVNRWLVKK